MFAILYNLALLLVRTLLKLIPFRHGKTKQWIEGQRDVFNTIKGFNFKEQPIWIHVSSYGEYEQVKPVIDRLLGENKELLVTFFSPSGYSAIAKKETGHKVAYLPLDTKTNVKKFLAMVNPSLAIFVKYDLWFNYLNKLNHSNIPVFFIDVIFSPSHWFFKWYGKPFKKLLLTIHTIYVQDYRSLDFAKQNNFTTKYAGDTRIDRVVEIAQQPFNHSILEQFTKEETMVAGSTWPEDEKFLIRLYNEHFLHQKTKLILAPHEISNEHITTLLNQFSNSTRLSKYSGDPNIYCLIVDSIGMLKHIYKYGALAYVGGGFGKGVHSILEPASFGLPTVFGPKHQHFIEAQEMISRNLSQEINDYASLLRAFIEIKNNHHLPTRIREFISSKQGASEIIVKDAIALLDK